MAHVDGEMMSVAALKRMRTNLRATLTKMEGASVPSEDTPEMAKLKASLRLRIASLDKAISDQKAADGMVPIDSAALAGGRR